MTAPVPDRPVVLEPVGPDNWRACAELVVGPGQEESVAPVTRYLALCAYDEGPRRPDAVRAAGAADRPVVGFVMAASTTTGRSGSADWSSTPGGSARATGAAGCTPSPSRRERVATTWCGSAV